jgi:hypothetical protein
MDLSGIIKESQLEKSVTLPTKTGHKSFIDGLYNWSINPAEIQYKSNKIRSLRHTLNKNTALSTKLREFYEEYTATESIIDEIQAPPTDESKESKSQLVFTHPDLKPLNFAPFLLLILYAMKVFIAPTFAILMPLILVLAPFMLIKYVYGMDVEFTYYLTVIKELIIKQSATTMETMQRVGHIGWVAVSLGQNIIQPVFTAMHIYRLNNIYSEHYNKINKLYIKWRSIMEEFSKEGWTFSDKSYAGWFETFCTDSRMFLAGIMEPLGFNCWMREIGNLHSLYYIATNSDFNPIKVLNTKKPYMKLINAFEPQVAPENRKKLTIESLQNSVLTGPNRGGKSTALRAILVNVLLAQSYGCCLADYMEFTPFNWIHSCLRLEDVPGSQSLFEREVFMAARSLKRLSNQNEKGLILIDELFHSTNPSDSNRASKLYTNKLWASDNCISVISTHDFDLVNSASNQVNRLCCPAHLDENNKISYTYTLVPGVCEISSVDDILIEKGVI